MSIKTAFISLISKSHTFVYKWGYMGIFFIAMLETGLIFLPYTSAPLVFTFGGILNPFLVALAAALGLTIGSISCYIFGAGGKELVEKKYGKEIKKIRNSFQNKGFFWIIFVTLTPIPDSIMCIFLGMIRYDIKKFFIAIFIGKLLVQLVIAYSGYYSIGWVLNVLQIQLPI